MKDTKGQRLPRLRNRHGRVVLKGRRRHDHPDASMVRSLGEPTLRCRLTP